VDCAHRLAVARPPPAQGQVLPAAFGSWNSVFVRFRRWAVKGLFNRIFNRLSGGPDFEYALIDGTIVRVHQHGTGAKGGLTIRPSGDRAAA